MVDQDEWDSSDSDFVVDSSDSNASSASEDEAAARAARPRSPPAPAAPPAWTPPSRGRWRREVERLRRSWALCLAAAGALRYIFVGVVWLRTVVLAAVWVAIPGLVPDPRCHRLLRGLRPPHPKALALRGLFAAFVVSRAARRSHEDCVTWPSIDYDLTLACLARRPVATLVAASASLVASALAFFAALYVQYGLVDDLLLGLINATYSATKRQQFVALLWRLRAWTR